MPATCKRSTATSKFKNAAEKLQRMHQDLENTTSTVVMADWIKSNYEPAENPTAPGYATILDNPVSKDFDHDLARRITAFLRDKAAHPNLRSITILGDAVDIPPSYYFFLRHYDDFNNWICSDLFYSSPDYDFVMNYELGRLPASSEEDAQLIIEKIIKRKTNMSSDWFMNAALVGGAPSCDWQMYGELTALDPVNRNYLRGFKIRKEFLTEGRENRDNVLPLFSNEEAGIIYHIGHGGGDTLSVGHDQIGHSDLMALPAKNRYPILLSIRVEYVLYTSRPDELKNTFFIDDISPVGMFESVKENQGITSTSYHVSGNPPRKYSYRVIAVDNDGLKSNPSNAQAVDCKTE
ncbi:MAG: C25 family cysteine peptidase [Acidobacteriota bacterium]